jgi:hypothetical protein
MLENPVLEPLRPPSDLIWLAPATGHESLTEAAHEGTYACPMT